MSDSPFRRHITLTAEEALDVVAAAEVAASKLQEIGHLLAAEELLEAIEVVVDRLLGA